MPASTVAPAPLARLVTAHELADLTALPLARVYELTRSGALPHVRLGRAIRYSPAAVAAFFDAGGTGPWAPGA